MSNARSLWQVVHPSMPFQGPKGTLDQVREWIRLRQEQKNHPRDAGLYSIGKVRTCDCCGTDDDVREPEKYAYRCDRHLDRNPCLIDGCGRTFDNKGDYRVQFVCGKHFRMAPLALRQSLKRIERLAKKRGWVDTLSRRHHQLWDRVVRSIKAALEGDIDIAEIHRVMGWD